MTIKIQHLTIQSDDSCYLGIDQTVEDVTNDQTYANDMLAVVRHIMRERGDCTIIPVVRKVIVHPTNEYGHNMQVEVTYSARGYRAIYGAHVGLVVSNVQCYMD